MVSVSYEEVTDVGSGVSDLLNVGVDSALTTSSEEAERSEKGVVGGE